MLYTSGDIGHSSSKRRERVGGIKNIRKGYRSTAQTSRATRKYVSLAFLGAPAAWFSSAPLDQAKFGSNAEGQRRKTEMLFNASVMKNRCSRYADPPTADHASAYSIFNTYCMLVRDRRRRKRELMDYVFIPAANPPNTNTP